MLYALHSESSATGIERMLSYICYPDRTQDFVCRSGSSDNAPARIEVIKLLSEESSRTAFSASDR